MAPFSKSSENNLAGVHPTLQDLLREITQYFDCAILPSTQRTVAQQKFMVEHKLSETLNSLHLVQSDGFRHAVDIAPTPIQWDNSPPATLSKYEVECIAFLFYVKGFAKARGVDIRIGADWNGNNLWTDNNFNDLDHIELPL